MKKSMILTALAVSLLVSAQEKELVRNGKFQDKPYAATEALPENCIAAKFPGWGFWNAKGSEGKIYLLEKAGAGFDDNRALLARDFKSGCILQQISVIPKGKYKVSLLCKYDGKTDITLGWHQKNGQWAFHKQNRRFHFTTDAGNGWKQAVCEVTVPDEAYGMSIMINLSNQQPGQDCLIDNVSVTAAE